MAYNTEANKPNAESNSTSTHTTQHKHAAHFPAFAFAFACPDPDPERERERGFMFMFVVNGRSAGNWRCVLCVPHIHVVQARRVFLMMSKKMHVFLKSKFIKLFLSQIMLKYDPILN